MTTITDPLDGWPGLDDPDRPCRGAGFDQFFPRANESGAALRARLTRTAEYYCRLCPLRELCRDLGAQSGHGMWGGVYYPDGSARRPIDLLDTGGG
ncbi:MAG TPA: WhiB family transcriptional regulator [Actinophytocola sp.]|uniref:WhiB family transcriptional regulator n=1 Tax=Actinophytocola sp. TaxID=1872138 RepID=UPI002DDCC0B3|nr:WhiB family transcriptional regulator [Actinophytocola sp.]HEV2778567.1 WhiB family transcriptional regulator [Actinophytocola sp.]